MSTEETLVHLSSLSGQFHEWANTVDLALSQLQGTLVTQSAEATLRVAEIQETLDAANARISELENKEEVPEPE